METKSGICRIGIGGWEHDAFDRCFYANADIDSLEKLEFYAQFFETVEVRATFWDGTLTANDAAQWASAVNGNRRFLFNIKLHQAFTHKKELNLHATRRMRGILQELSRQDRLGTVLAQFPYSFTNTSAHRYHLIKLSQLFSGFPVHVEFRHESWNQPAIGNILAETSLGLVAADLPRVRQFMPFTTSAVGETAYVRLHGRNEKGWILNGMDTRYDYLYNSREIRELLRRVDALSRKFKNVIVIFNNTAEGKAIANALQFAAALREGKRVLVPQAALSAFPQLEAIASHAEAEDMLLETSLYRRAM